MCVIIWFLSIYCYIFVIFAPFSLQAVLYEEPQFQGPCVEIDTGVYDVSENDEENKESGDEGENTAQKKKPTNIGSLKILRGLWVGAVLNLLQSIMGFMLKIRGCIDMINTCI